MRHAMMVAALLVAASAQAEIPGLSASLGFSSEIYTARAWDLVDDDDHLPMLRVGAGVSFELGKGLVDVEAAYQSGSSRVSIHAVDQTSFWLRGARVGAAYRYRLFQYAEPYVQLGAGVDWATLTLQSGTTLTQTVAAPMGSGLVGVQVPVRMGVGPGRLPFLVFDLGVGGVLRPNVAFSELRRPDPAKPAVDPVGQGAVNLGSMPLSGLTFRLLVTTRW